MDSPTANEAVVATTRSLRADVTLVARARDASHARALYQLGVTDAVPETIEASLQLSEAVLVDIGVPMGLVIASVHEKRDEYRKFLVAAGAPVPHDAEGRAAMRRSQGFSLRMAGIGPAASGPSRFPANRGRTGISSVFPPKILK
jgi:Trk K+ transport system NAD-binding subunit